MKVPNSMADKEKICLKELEVKLKIECFMPIYCQTAIQDLEGLLAVWKEVHGSACTIIIKTHKEVKLKKKVHYETIE